MMLYCGVAAAGTDEGASQDYDRALDILDDCPDCSEEAARAEAERIVAEHSQQIARDAAALLENGRL